jgi:hypothetical protein
MASISAVTGWGGHGWSGRSTGQVGPAVTVPRTALAEVVADVDVVDVLDVVDVVEDLAVVRVVEVVRSPVIVDVVVDASSLVADTRPPP